MSERLPLPSPRFLNQGQSAAYVGVSAVTFAREVAAGLWPAPMRRGAKEGALTWDRNLLDAAADLLGGIATPGPAAASVMADAERRALEASARGTTPKVRTQQRHAPTR